MAEVIRMPLLSDTMKEGVIAAWNKKVGDQVKSDDVIAEVETDKATMEVMPYVDGTLLYVAGDKGVAIPVNGIMAIVGEEGEDYKELLAQEESQDSTDTQPNGDKDNEEKSQTTDENSDEDNDESTEDAPIPDDVTVVRMPLLSDTMKEGKIVSWLKKEGDKVKSDDVLAEVETDKATMEVMGYADGTLLHIGVPAGEAAKINAIIAIVGPEGTDISAILNNEKNKKNNQNSKDTKAKDTKAKDDSQTSKKPAAQDGDTKHQSSSDDDRIKISPLARHMAKEKGIDINQIQGTGDGGRIIKRDIEDYKPAAAAATSGTTAFVPTGQESYEDIPLSQMRNIIAQRLSESKFGAPHFYLTISLKMDRAMEARKAMNAISPVKISFNDFIIKAVAMALRKHPEVNSSWMGDFIRKNNHIHIGTAVAVDEGLIVPVIRFADQKTLSQIANDANKLIEKARNKKLQPPEFTGNTFTISNLGMMDIDEFTAIINPPDACILAVGKIAETPVVEEGQIVVRHIMKLTLSCDHRVVDGAKGAAFLQTLKAYLENPINMLV